MFRVPRFLNTVKIIARPTAASAAATTITKKLKMCPFTCFNWYEKVMKLRFTALSISSMDMNTVITLRRSTKPETPSANSTALRIRYQEMGTPVILLQLLSRQHHGAQNGDQNEDRHHLERQQKLREQRAAHVERGAVPEGAEMHHRGSREQ